MTTTAATTEHKDTRKHPLVGHRFQDGHLRIQPYEDWLARDAIGAERTAPRPHAAWTLLGTFRGMGADLAEFFRLMEAAEDDGVMFGESRIEQDRPLEHDHDYVVTCEITDVHRRHGTKVPVFDLVEYLVSVRDDDGDLVRCRNSFVVPRRTA